MNAAYLPNQEARRTYRVEEAEVPVSRQVVPGERVGLGADGQGGLDGDVHDHDTLGTEMEGQDLKGIGDKETRETNVVEDTENPDEDDLADTVAGLSAGLVVHSGHDGPDSEGKNHTCINMLISVPFVTHSRLGRLPVMAVRKRGRRPTRSTMKAAPMEQDKSRTVLPAEIYNRGQGLISGMSEKMGWLDVHQASGSGR